MDPRRVFFVLLLADQILLPLTQVLGPKPARFAWQMFSGSGQHLHAAGVD